MTIESALIGKLGGLVPTTIDGPGVIAASGQQVWVTPAIPIGRIFIMWITGDTIGLEIYLKGGFTGNTKAQRGVGALATSAPGGAMTVFADLTNYVGGSRSVNKIHYLII